MRNRKKMTTISMDSGPLTQDEIDTLKNLLTQLGYNSSRDKEKASVLDLKPVEPYVLSLRQIDICKHISNGVNDKEIRGELHISHSTLKREIRLIFDKLEVETRCHAISSLFRLKILD